MRVLFLFSVFLMISCRTGQMADEEDFSESDISAEFDDFEDFDDFEEAGEESAKAEELDETPPQKEDDESIAATEEPEEPAEENDESIEEEEVELVDEEDLEGLEDVDIIVDDDEEDESTLAEKEFVEEDESTLAEKESVEEKDESTLAEKESVEEKDETTLAEKESVEEENIQAETEEPLKSPSVIVNSIRYSASENKIYIKGTESPLSYQSRENVSNNQTIIEIPGAVLADNLKYPFVMKDFDSQIAVLTADQKDPDTVRIVIQMRKQAATPSIRVSDSGALVVSAEGTEGKPDPLSTLEDGADSFGKSFPVLPAKSFEEFFTSHPQFSGSPISIHLKNVNIRDVLYFISEETGLNMVIDDNVQGAITIKLKNVPWDQALVTIMKTKKLGYLREGNVIRIMTLSSLKTYQKELDDIKEKKRVLDPLKTKAIPIVYAKAGEISSSIKNFLTPQRGKAEVDAKSNSIILMDTEDTLNKIAAFIKYMDKPPKQVMITAKIVEARESFVRSLGLNWNLNLKDVNLNSVFGRPDWSLNLDGTLNILPGARSGGDSSTAERTFTYPLNISFTPVGFLDAVISMSETDGTANVISSPRILVLSGKSATISQTTENIDVVINQSSNTGQTLGSQPQKTPIVLNFTVTPEVTATNSVFMKISMKRDFAGNRDPASNSRPTNSREANTEVLAQNGQTIVIGGIYQSDQTQFKEGLPILRHIPILKWLFSQRTKDESRNELLLFVTPRVLSAEQKAPAVEETFLDETSAAIKQEYNTKI